MKKIRILLILLLITNIVTSCKKEVIEDPLPVQDPVFYATGSVGDESFSAEAGNDNFYMETYGKVVRGVNFYAGKLSDNNFELEIGIYNGNLDYANIPASDGIPDMLNFAMMPTEPLAILSKDLLPNYMFIERIIWSLNGEYAGVDNVSITNPGKYNVCAAVKFVDGTEANLCNEMILGYTKHATGQIRHFLSQSGNLQVWVEADQVAISSVKWFIDGVFEADIMKLQKSIDANNHKITAEITFVNGVKRIKSILIDGSLSGKFIDDFSVFEVGSNLVNWDYNAQITLIKDGKEYTSILAPNESAEVEITDAVLYGKNSAGNLVYKISGNISCFLKEMGSGKIVPFNCTTTFGVEIK